MSINSILNIGVSGLMTAQSQLKVVSDNISNVNTPGYIRKIGGQEAQVLGGKGMGVTTTQITLAGSKYLQSAAINASSSTAQAEIFYELFDQIQSQFGDLTNESSLFNLGDDTFSAIANAAENTQSSAARQEVVSSLKSFLDEGGRISREIQETRANADNRIAASVKSINDLVENITKLNSVISQATVSGSDASGAQTTQSSYIDALSKLIDVKVAQNGNGGVSVTTKSGLPLAGENAITLSYVPTSPTTATTTFNQIVYTGPSGEKRDLSEHIAGGELRGLLDLRDKDSVAVSDQLSEYMAVYADKLNAAHNAATGVPAPDSLTGKAMNLTLAEALSGFEGQTNLVVLDADGGIEREVGLNFDTMQMTVDGVAAGPFTAATFQTNVNTALGGFGSVNFTDGKLTVAASGTNGIAIVDDATNGSEKLGKGFSHYFGLNDLVTTDAPIDYATGLTAASNHGFTAGQTIGFQVSNAGGTRLTTVDVVVPAGGTMTDMVNALNDSTTGLGRYGTFSLNPDSGTLSFKGFGSPAHSLSITEDNTARLGTGASFSQFFGIGGVASERAQNLTVNPEVMGNLDRLSLAQVDLSVTGTSPALVAGDGKGGQLMAAVGTGNATFSKAGYNAGGVSSLSRYAADLAGQVGTLASQAESRMDASRALSTEAESRRRAYEGVNLDEELVNLTTFQQAYSASSRLIQAAKDMYDVLLNMM